MSDLSALDPQSGPSPNPAASSRINFICPRCRRGRVVVDLRLGEPRAGVHGANVLPPNWSAMTITPSVAAEGTCRHCPGWHGFIIKGGIA